MARQVIAIVGAGFAGGALACALAERDPGRVEVRLIDRSGRFGPGLAYGADQAGALLNVRASAMGASLDDPDAFARWVRSETGAAADAFVCRALYGRYLSERLTRAAARSADGFSFIKGEVMGVRRLGGRFRVELGSGAWLTADAVVLALGALPAQPPDGSEQLERHPLYRRNPWGSDALDGLEPGATILALGAGLTMADIALKAIEVHGASRVIALSRRGALPRAHAPDPPLLADAACVKPGDSPLAALRALRAQTRRQDWRAAVDRLRPITTEIWRAWSVAEQRQFLRHARPWWDAHRHRLAPEAAARLQRAEAEGRLHPIAGRVCGLRDLAGATRVRIRLRGRQTGPEIAVDRIVNCTGPGGDIARARDPLILSLLAGGLVRPDPLGLGFDVTDGAQPLDRSGATTPGLWAVGALTRGRFWESTAAPDIRRQVDALARELLSLTARARRA